MTVLAPAHTFETSSELNELDRMCREGFGGLIDHLSEIRSAGELIVTSLEQLALMGERNRGLGEVRGYLTAVQEARVAFDLAASESRSATIQRVALSLQQQMSTIRRRGTLLWAVSSRFRSAAAGANVTTFEEYSRVLRDVAQALVDNSDQVLEEITTVEVREVASINAAKCASKSLCVLENQVTKPLTRARQLTREMIETGEKLSQAAGEHKARLQGGIVNLISVIQFSDQMAQRLDHIGQIQGFGLRGGRLAAAQLRALAEDLCTATTDAEGLLRGVSMASKIALAEINAEGFGGAVLTAIDCQRDMLNKTIEHSEPVVQAATDAEENLEDLGNALNAAARSFEELRKISVNVTQASHNSMVMAAREGGNEREAFFVLSRSVNEAAKDCMGAIQSSESALSGLKNRSVGEFVEVHRKMRDMTTLLKQGFVDLSEIESSNDELQKVVAKSREVQVDLAETIKVALQDVEMLAELPEQMLRLADAVDDEILPDEDMASQIRGLYTMEVERQVHDACVGCALQPSQSFPADPEPTDGDASIDDVFF